MGAHELLDFRISKALGERRGVPTHQAGNRFRIQAPVKALSYSTEGSRCEAGSYFGATRSTLSVLPDARGAIVALLFIDSGLLPGLAGLIPEPQSAEAALLSEVKKLLASDGQVDIGKPTLTALAASVYWRWVGGFGGQTLGRRLVSCPNSTKSCPAF